LAPIAVLGGVAVSYERGAPVTPAGRGGRCGRGRVRSMLVSLPADILFTKTTEQQTCALRNGQSWSPSKDKSGRTGEKLRAWARACGMPYFHTAGLYPTPYTLHPNPTLRTQHPTPYTLHPTPFTLHPIPYTPHPTAQPTPKHKHKPRPKLKPKPTAKPKPKPRPKPYTLHPIPYTLHLTPYTLLPTL